MMTLLPRSILKALLISASLAAAHVFGVSVASDPVGAIAYTLPHASDVNLGVMVAPPSAFEGRVASVDVASNTVTFQGTPNWATDAFITPTKPHYLYIKSGAEEGMHVRVIGNTANSVTVSLNKGDRLDRLVVGEAASVVPYWTPRTFFGDAAVNGLRIHFYRADSVGMNIRSNIQIEFNNGEWYVDGTNEIYSDTPLHPGESFLVRNSEPTPISFETTGVIPMAAIRIVLRSDSLTSALKEQRITFFTAAPFLLAETLPYADADNLGAYSVSVTGYNKVPYETSCYFWGDWYDTSTFAIRDQNYTVHPGRGYLYYGYQNAQTEAAVWVRPQPYLN